MLVPISEIKVNAAGPQAVLAIVRLMQDTALTY